MFAGYVKYCLPNSWALTWIWIQIQDKINPLSINKASNKSNH